LSKEAAKFEAWPAHYTERLADLAYDYLVAHQTGDFEIYWRFRVPTGRGFMHPEAAANHRKRLLRWQQMTGVTLVDAAKLETVNEPKDLFALTWRMMDYPEEPTGRKITWCKTCFQAVALGEVRLDWLPSQEPDTSRASFNFLDHVRKYQPQGGFLSAGTVVALPRYSSAMERDPAAFRFVSLMFPLKLASGIATTTGLLAYWNEIEQRFLPVALVICNSANGRPTMLF